MYNTILIGVDEIWLKSEITKKKLFDMLLQQIKDRLKIDRIEEKRGRIIIDGYDHRYIEDLKKVFGVKTIYPAVRVKNEIEKISEVVKDFLKNYQGTFKIKTRRVYKKFPMTSLEISRNVGNYITKNLNLKVDLKKPGKTIYVEIHKDFSYVSDKKLSGLGGLPLGSEGKALMLFSGGIDSMTASILIGRRGLNLDFLFINIAGNIMEQFVIRSFEKIMEFFPHSRLFVLDLDFEKFLKIKEGYRQICFKLLMYKIAEKFSRLKDYKAFVTGESLAQVSSQTLDSLILLQNQVKIPVIRPLISMNKDEIFEMGRKYGLLKYISPEICQLESHSNAHPKEEIVLEEFSKLEIDLEKIIERIREARKEEVDLSYFISYFDKDIEVVDIKDFEKTEFSRDKKYLIVCKTGLLSYSFAKLLRQKGIEAYASDYKTAIRLGYKTFKN